MCWCRRPLTQPRGDAARDSICEQVEQILAQHYIAASLRDSAGLGGLRSV
ncbi:hypothetical protein DO73_4191 [Burkholderia pseudomallei]|nr:hypothetical protein DO73_4191 [Burkholderia pseudomallei]